VGVFSVDAGSESVGEISESVCRWGEVITLRSYSSSASESSWYWVLKAILRQSQWELFEIRSSFRTLGIVPVEELCSTCRSNRLVWENNSWIKRRIGEPLKLETFVMGPLACVRITKATITGYIGWIEGDGSSTKAMNL
jgi:hypothetical protein